jgi:L-rhamnose mutarotase
MEGMEDEYDRRHREIWPELVDEMRKAGVREFRIFRQGRSVICCFGADPDLATVTPRMDAGAAGARWSAYMADVLEGDGEIHDEVWALS